MAISSLDVLRRNSLRLTFCMLGLLVWPFLHGEVQAQVQSNAQQRVPVEAIALFKARAVIRSAAGQEMLKEGQTGKYGVTLIAANTSRAKIRYKNKVYELRLNSRVGSNFVKPTQSIVRISRDEYGQYRMRGAINNHYVNFLVDTGASLVAMSERHAVSMGIDFRAGQSGMVQTAQGNTSAYFLLLDEVTLGGIKQRQVRATVIEGNYPVDVLLGMSFLNDLRLNDDAGVLTLTAKF